MAAGVPRRVWGGPGCLRRVVCFLVLCLNTVFRIQLIKLKLKLSFQLKLEYYILNIILFASVLYRGLRSGGGSDPPLRGPLIS